MVNNLGFILIYLQTFFHKDENNSTLLNEILFIMTIFAVYTG